jgi:hypothetical protein
MQKDQDPSQPATKCSSGVISPDYILVSSCMLIARVTIGCFPPQRCALASQLDATFVHRPKWFLEAIAFLSWGPPVLTNFYP